MNDQIGVKARGCWWTRRKISLEDYWYNVRRRWWSIDGGISRRFQRQNSDSIFELQGFSSPSFDISFIPTLSNDHTFLRLVPLFPTLKVRNLTKHCSFETSPLGFYSNCLQQVDATIPVTCSDFIPWYFICRHDLPKPTDVLLCRI